MSAERITNSAESLFWNSNYSRIMNFHDSGQERAAQGSSRASSRALHPDVYFQMVFVPFVTRNSLPR
jgi:hypothetical protein